MKLNKQHNMSQVEFQGRVYSITKIGKQLNFLVMNTGEELVQCIFDCVIKIPIESIIRVRGYLQTKEISKKYKKEIIVREYEIISENKSITTKFFLEKQNNKKNFKYRHIYMRQSEVRDRFILKWKGIQSLREFLIKKKFVEVQSPKIVGDMTDGPVKKFSVDFFGEKAFLTISNLLYHAAYISADFNKVFEISPLFRSDLNRTSQHMSEFYILEITAAFQGRFKMIQLCNKLLKILCIVCKREDLFSFLRNIPILSYFEAVRICEKFKDNPLICGERIKNYHAKFISKSLCNPFFWIIDIPAQQKNFFSSIRYDDELKENVANDFRLYWDDFDIIDGGERINDPQFLITRLREKGLNLDNFDYYLNVLQSGMPPFVGLGIGIDRLFGKLMKLNNIRDTTPFPRFIDHFIP